MTETSTHSSIITITTTDHLHPTPSSALPLATEKFSVRAHIDQKSGNSEVSIVNVSLTGSDIRVFYAASDNTTSLRIHLDARSILSVSLLVSLAIFLVILASLLLICYSDRCRNVLYRRVRIALRERHSPPPSIF